jgi:hypothetical protein
MLLTNSPFHGSRIVCQTRYALGRPPNLNTSRDEIDNTLHNFNYAGVLSDLNFHVFKFREGVLGRPGY